MLKDKLKEYRQLCDFSQQQVADCLNVHRSTYSYYELGKTEPSLENICMLATLFGVSLYDLLEVSLPASPSLGDNGIAPPGGKRKNLDDDVGTKIGDLSRDEKVLVSLFRLLTNRQKKDLLAAMTDNRTTDKKD